jgi:hypothetical protein
VCSFKEILEKVKKEVVKHKDGSESVHYTSDKSGHKIVYRDGEPIEVRQDFEEKKTRKKGQQEKGKFKQKGITKNTKFAMKKIKERNKDVQ